MDYFFYQFLSKHCCIFKTKIWGNFFKQKQNISKKKFYSNSIQILAQSAGAVEYTNCTSA